MKTLKYTVIKTNSQYKEYCSLLERLADTEPSEENVADEIELLTLLIDKWDEEHNSFKEVDPIKLLHSFMEDHGMKAKDLVKILDVSKGYVSDILNCKKGLSKEVIRDLSAYFNVSQEAFNRPYKLKPKRSAGGSPVNAKLKNASVMNTRKS
jgi:HTH-type transcriptional regulator / antitoxin HigA